MPKGDKFIALTSYLENCGMDELRMSFSEIEKIIGFKLSDSAYSYRHNGLIQNHSLLHLAGLMQDI